MQTIKLLSATDYALTQAVFPALRHAFTADSIVAGTQMHDIIGNAVWNAGGGISVANDQFYLTDALGTFSEVSGGYDALGSDDFVIMQVGTFPVAPTFEIGNKSGATGLRATSVATQSRIQRAVDNYQVTAALTKTTGLECLALARSGAVITKIGVAESTGAVETNATATTTVGTLAGNFAAMTSFASIATDVTNKYSGIYIFSFASGNPTAREIGLAGCWMAANPGRVYPMWAGRT